MKTKNFRQKLTKRIMQAFRMALPEGFRTLRKKPLNSDRKLEVLLARLESLWEVYLVPLSVSLAALLRDSSVGLEHGGDDYPSIRGPFDDLTTDATAGKSTKDQIDENVLDN